MKRAFTLIELMIVIAIIAILAGIALPVFQKIQKKGQAYHQAAPGSLVGVVIQLNDNPVMRCWNGRLVNNGMPAAFDIPYSTRTETLVSVLKDTMRAGVPVEVEYNSSPSFVTRVNLLDAKGTVTQSYQ